MKHWSVPVLILLLSACQAPVIPGASSPPPQLQAQSAGRQTVARPINPPAFGPAVQQLMRTPDTEADPPTPRTPDFSQYEPILGINYIEAHSYYFRTLDGDASSIEAILKRDGHTRAAALLTRWRDMLGAEAKWPDQASTTYQGRWPALEHAILKKGDGWFWFKDAGTKADEYYDRALKAWRRDLPPEAPEQRESLMWLARASHFIHDMTVPFHTVSLIRPAQLIHHTPYEKSVDATFNQYLPSRNANPGNIWLPSGPYAESAQYWGLYFPASTTAGDITRYAAGTARHFYPWVRNAVDRNNGNWEKTRAAMVTLGAKTTAGLVVAFMETVGAPTR
jgi:hypothetical protein